MDSLDIAEKNSTNLKNIINNLDGIYKQNYTIISDLVKDKWAISINMDIDKFNNFLIEGKYKNRYEKLKDDLERLPNGVGENISTKEVLRRELKKHYSKRIIFDSSFKDGKKFKYGALNIGGPGIHKYGDICLVIAKSFVNNDASVAFIKGDSLSYVNESKVDVEKLTTDSSNKNLVHILAAIKHCTCTCEIDPIMLPSIVCCEHSYIEAITKNDIEPQHIHKVRIRKTKVEEYYGYLYEKYANGLSDIEKLRDLQEFLRMNDLIKDKGIELEVVG